MSAVLYMSDYRYTSRCKTCGRVFSVYPPPEDKNNDDWKRCLADDCESYDLDRDPNKSQK